MNTTLLISKKAASMLTKDTRLGQTTTQMRFINTDAIGVMNPSTKFPVASASRKELRSWEKRLGRKITLRLQCDALWGGILQLSGDEFSAYKWICLLPRVGDRMKMRCMTPPEAKVEVNDTEPGSVWMVGLPFNNNPNRVQTTTQLSLSKNMCEKL